MDMTAPVQAQEDYNAAIMNRLPVGRWGKVEDLSGMTIYLASRARWVISFPELVAERC